MKKQSLIKLCKKIGKGDKTAMERLYNALYYPIYSYLYGYVLSKEVAQDLVHDTFIKAIYALKGRKYISNVLAWMFVIARNTAIDHLRKTKRNSTFTELDVEEDNSTTVQENFRENDSSLDKDFVTESKLMSIFHDLSPGDRELIIFRYWNEYSSAEMSRITGKTRESVRKQLSRILREIREQLN